MSRFGRGKPDPLEPDPFASVPDVDERLADFVDGMMSARDRERFEAEMRVSPQLREQVAEYEQTVASIRDALNAETHETNLADRVMESLAQQANGAGRRPRSGWPLVWAITSAAALLGIAVLVDAWGGTVLAPKTQNGTAAHQVDPTRATNPSRDAAPPESAAVSDGAGSQDPSEGDRNARRVEPYSESGQQESGQQEPGQPAGAGQPVGTGRVGAGSPDLEQEQAKRKGNDLRHSEAKGGVDAKGREEALRLGGGAGGVAGERKEVGSDPAVRVDVDKSVAGKAGRERALEAEEVAEGLGRVGDEKAGNEKGGNQKADEKKAEANRADPSRLDPNRERRQLAEKQRSELGSTGEGPAGGNPAPTVAPRKSADAGKKAAGDPTRRMKRRQGSALGSGGGAEGSVAQPNSSIPNSDVPKSVGPAGPASAGPAGPASPGPAGPSGPAPAGPSTGGPQTGGPQTGGPQTRGPQTTGPQTTGPSTGATGAGGPAGPSARPPAGPGRRGRVGAAPSEAPPSATAGGRGGNFRTGGRGGRPATKPDAQAGLAGGAGEPRMRKATGAKDSHQAESAKPKQTPRPEGSARPEAWRGPGDTIPGAGGGAGVVPESVSPGAKKSAKQPADDARDRGLRQLASGDRAYLMRLADDEDADKAEVLPLVTVDGLAVMFDYPEALDKLRKDRIEKSRSAKDGAPTDRGRAEGKPKAQTGSDDFYLGSARTRRDSALRTFFDSQMRPATGWQEMRREVDKRARDAFEAEQDRVVTIGGLRLVRVGPPVGANEDGVADQNETQQRRSRQGTRALERANGQGERTADKPGADKRAANDAARYSIPGESDANGGAVEQRDWLVVGPRSEVAKLLLELRSYSDVVDTRKLGSGEVRLAEATPAGGRSFDRRLDADGKPVVSELEGVSSEAKKSKPSTGATQRRTPRTGAAVEPQQRVVIRFRVRR